MDTASIELTPFTKKAKSQLIKQIKEQTVLRQREKPIVVKAAQHTFTYTFENELRFGPPYYTLSVKGEFADKFNRLFKGKYFFYSMSPFNAESGIYLFEMATNIDRNERQMLIYSLHSARKISSIDSSSLLPLCWRPGSDELIILGWYDNYWKKWQVRSRKANAMHDLFQGPNEANVTHDGHFLLMYQTGPPLVCLYDLQAEKVLKIITKRDFKKLTDNPVTLTFAGFDAKDGRLDLMVNSSISYHPKFSVRYDLAVSVDIIQSE